MSAKNYNLLKDKVKHFLEPLLLVLTLIISACASLSQSEQTQPAPASFSTATFLPPTIAPTRINTPIITPTPTDGPDTLARNGIKQNRESLSPGFVLKLFFQRQPRFLPGRGSTLQHPQVGVPLRQERGNSFFAIPEVRQ